MGAGELTFAPLKSFRRFIGLTNVVVDVGALSAREAMFDGLGFYSRKVTTASPKAVHYFNQGLGFFHGFNHGVALLAFKEAARVDSARSLRQ
jgi:hypothetical protein